MDSCEIPLGESKGILALGCEFLTMPQGPKVGPRTPHDSAHTLHFKMSEPEILNLLQIGPKKSLEGTIMIC